MVSLVVSTSNIQLSYGQYYIESPLKQLQRGVLDTDVRCAQGFVLIFKTTDVSPACVKPSTEDKLVARGWAITIKNVDQNSNRDYNLVFLVNLKTPQYNATMNSIARYLKGGDYLLVEGLENSSQLEQNLKEIRIFVNPEVNLGAIRIYNEIEKLTETVPNLPKGFDYIGYDYEEGNGFSPEFTVNETTSISYFDKARSAVEQYNAKTGSSAKLLILPPYGELMKANWNWGLAAKHVDVIDMQFQTFVHDPKLQDYVLNSVAQVKKEAPSAKVFIQLSLVETRGTAQDNLNAINTLHKLPIDAFLMFYHPYNTFELDQFLQIIPK